MILMGLAMLLSVNLGGGFGEASAEIASISDVSMNVRIEVEVETSATSVVAHLVAPGEQDLTLPLLPRGGGLYGIQTDLRPIDYVVVFEAIGEVDTLSQPVSFSDMGADFLPRVTTTDSGTDELPSTVRRWGWAALALTAASLSLLAFWVLGERSDGGDVRNGPADVEPSGDSG